MNKFKPIITHPEGQNLFPGLPTLIEGENNGTSITMKNTKPQIGLTAYGASYMMPNQDYNFAGNTVLELPLAQMGGGSQEEQIQQLLSAYAQMKGMAPEELMQKLRSLAPEQQQQALQAIQQEVQQAMAQQQAPEEEMPMAKDGGCMDCEEQFPQAQNLKSYYKAQTGRQVYTPSNNVASRESTDTIYTPYQKPDPNATSQYLRDASGDYAGSIALGLSPLDTPVDIISAINDLKNQDYDKLAISGLGAMLPGLSALTLKTGYDDLKNSFRDKYNEYLKEKSKEYRSSNKKAQGGKACIDCEEQFPQAQNLKSYYKAQMGRQVYTPQDRAQDSTYYADYAIPANMRKILLGDTFDSYEQIGSAEDYGYDASVEEMMEQLRNPKKMGYSNARQASIDAFRNKGAAGKLYLTNNEVAEIAKRFKDIDAEGKYTTPNNPMYGSNSYDLKATLSAPDYWRVMQEINRNKSKKADGGNVSPQAQTYLPYDRGTKPPANFMFRQGGSADQYGGTTDMEQIYKVMKAGGFAMDPKKKKGGMFDPNSFEDYLMKNGGLRKFQGPEQSQVDEDDFGSYGQRQVGIPYEQPAAIAAQAQPSARQQAIQTYVERGAFPQDLIKKQPTAVAPNPTAPAKKLPSGLYPYGLSPYNTIQLIGSQSKRGSIPHALAAITGVGHALGTSASGWQSAFNKDSWNNYFGSGESDEAAYGGGLPRAQWAGQWDTQSMPASVQNNPGFQQVQQANANQITMTPASQVQGTDWSGGLPSNDAQAIDLGQNLSDPTMPQPKKQVRRMSGIPQAQSAIAGLATGADFLEALQEKRQNDDFRSKINTSEFMGSFQIGGRLDYGDYMTNSGVFRPNDLSYAQKQSKAFMEQPSIYAQGGILDSYEDGGVYDLTQEEIDAILAAGGTIDYI